MTANATSMPLDWVDPDDAPVLTDHFFDNAEVKIGERVMRAASGTMSGRAHPPEAEAPPEPEPSQPSLAAPSPSPTVPVQQAATSQEQMLARLKEAMGVGAHPAAEAAGDGRSPLYTGLVRELDAATSDGALRQWARATAERRSRLSPTERSMLRTEIAAKQAWLEAQEQAGEGRESS